MAKFRYWSDLHLTQAAFVPPPILDDVDAVLIGGDTHTRGRHLISGEALARKIARPVIMVWGNHEGYSGNHRDLRRRERERLAELQADGVDLHVLHGEAVEIAGVRIVGATLWTDMRLFPDAEAEARREALAMMNDYRSIRLGGGHYRRIDVADTIGWHHAERRDLRPVGRAPGRATPRPHAPRAEPAMPRP